MFGIDLDVEAITGPRFFRLARRTFAYRGVMRARWENEQRDNEPRPAPETPATVPVRESAGPKTVSFDAFREQFPGLISHSSSHSGGR